jgi:hypothetical protein
MNAKFLILLIPIIIITVFIFQFSNQDEAVADGSLDAYAYATFSAG